MLYPTSGDQREAGIFWRRVHPYPIWAADFGDGLYAEIRNLRGTFWIYLIFWEGKCIKESQHLSSTTGEVATRLVRAELDRMGLYDDQDDQQVYDFPRMELRRGDV